MFGGDASGRGGTRIMRPLRCSDGTFTVKAGRPALRSPEVREVHARPGLTHVVARIVHGRFAVVAKNVR